MLDFYEENYGMNEIQIIVMEKIQKNLSGLSISEAKDVLMVVGWEIDKNSTVTFSKNSP